MKEFLNISKSPVSDIKAEFYQIVKFFKNLESTPDAFYDDFYSSLIFY